MSEYERPGVYVEETLNPIPPVVGAESTAVAAFIGASDRGPVQPVLVTSWSQYVNLYGGWNTRNGHTNELPLAVWMFFQNGGSSAYIQRAMTSYDPDVAVKSYNTFSDSGVSPLPRLTVQARNAGTWGNDIRIGISASTVANSYDLVVYYGGATRAYSVERFSAVSNNPSSKRYAPNVINGASRYIYVTVTNPSVNPAATVTPVALTSGTYGAPGNTTVDESVIAGSVSKFNAVNNALILNACGVVTQEYVDEVTAYAEDRGDVFVVIDPSPLASTAASELELVNGDGVSTAGYTPTSYAAVYYPRLVVKNPTVSNSNSTLTISPSGAVIGLYASTDASRGVFKAPAGLGARLSGVISVQRLTNDTLDNMNSAALPVNAIRYIAGSGVVVMGARTLKGEFVDRYVPVRRTLIYLRKSLMDLTEFALFEPNDERLWRNLTDVCTKFLTSFWQTGGLRGDIPSDAFFVKCDSDNNDLASIDAGEVNIEVGVALQRPAEYVIIKIGQFEGGTTVVSETTEE